MSLCLCYSYRLQKETIALNKIRTDIFAKVGSHIHEIIILKGMRKEEMMRRNVGGRVKENVIKFRL